MPRTAPLAAALAAVLLAAGCSDSRPARRPAATGEEAPAPSTEAERTRRMEDEAQAIRDRWSEVQQMEGTEAEKQRAVEELMERQQQLMRDGEGGAPVDEGAAPPD